VRTPSRPFGFWDEAIAETGGRRGKCVGRSLSGRVRTLIRMGGRFASWKPWSRSLVTGPIAQILPRSATDAWIPILPRRGHSGETFDFSTLVPASRLSATTGVASGCGQKCLGRFLDHLDFNCDSPFPPPVLTFSTYASPIPRFWHFLTERISSSRSPWASVLSAHWFSRLSNKIPSQFSLNVVWLYVGRGGCLV
jgi:hypothetical protein